MRVDKRLFPAIIVTVFIAAVLVAFLAGLRPGREGHDGTSLLPTLVSIALSGGAHA